MAKQYGMVIDLQKCVGCGACALACKTENNTQARSGGQTFNWADFLYEEEGKFPAVKFTAMPVLCNHCSNAACVNACPVQPKAMYKTADGITMHNQERCIGCRLCQKACPYSAMDVDKEEAAYSVISFNEHGQPVHAAYRDTSVMIADCTASGAETAAASGGIPPSENKFAHPDYASVRKAGVVEKCHFCDHRLKEGLLPRCVEACPAKARVFGDIADPASEAAQLLKKYAPTYLKPEKGTKPNVAYIRSYFSTKAS